MLACPQAATFNLGAKLTGTRFTRMAVAPPRHESVPTNRKPDWVVREKTSTEQALIYRLSGDYNPLHVGASRLPLIHSIKILIKGCAPQTRASALRPVSVA